jgi:hypothetical protein
LKPAPFVAWALFFLIALWLCALQGLLAAPGALGAWTPDLGLVLLLTWAGRLGRGRVEVGALMVAGARASLGADPPVALAAAYLGAALLVSFLRTGLEIDRPVLRVLSAGTLAWLVAHFLVASSTAALAASGSGAEAIDARLWPAAASTALAGLVLAPLLRQLPGPARRTRRP